MDALTEAQNSVGADDEMAGKVFEAYCAMVNDAILNKVSKETWVMFFKALGYDTDIEDAKATGELKGRNAKIKDLKGKKDNLPPAISSQSSAEPMDKPKEDLGALSRAGMPDSYERGGYKRK